MKIHNVRSLSLVSFLFTAALAVPALANPSAVPPEATTTSTQTMQTIEGIGPRFALGVSSPTGWLEGSFGASLSVGLSRHHALRANVARHNADGLLPRLFAIAAGGERAPANGGVLDASLGWIYFPRKLWDGLMLEAGVLRRGYDVEERDLDSVTTRTVTHAGRAMIGWSWPITRHVFISAAAGLSVGREVGEATRMTVDGASTTTTIDRRAVSPEIYLRFGFTFGR